MIAAPEPCPKCGAQAKLRKTCQRCGEGVWVYEHGGHYKWGNEVVPCRCAMVNTKENEHFRQEKQKRRKTRDTGKVTGPNRSGITTPEMAKKAAAGLARGLPVKRALEEAGFPKSSTLHGRKGINRMVRAELKSLGRKYVEMGRDLSPEEQEALVRGRLMENVIIGTDKGVLSTKQLGADKRVAMWQPDSQVGLVVLQAPAVPKIAHHVPLFHVEQEEEEEAK